MDRNITLSDVEKFKCSIQELNHLRFELGPAPYKSIALCTIDNQGNIMLTSDYVSYDTMWYMLWMYEAAKTNKF